MADDGWESSRNQAKDPGSRIIIFGEPRVPGCCTIQVCIPQCPMPVGTVWYRWNGNSVIEVLQSYVVGPLRRCGLRTALHNQMIDSYPTVKKIITAGANDTSKPWLKATGFRINKESGDWEFVVKRGKRK